MADIESDSEVQFMVKSNAEGEQIDPMQTTEDAEVFSVDENMSNCSSPRKAVPVNRRLQSETFAPRFRNMSDMQALDRDDDNRPPQHRRGPQMKPETFNGDEDWECYLTHFELCAELSGWSKRETVLTLAASLRGHARVFYMNLNAVERSSYPILTRKLSQRFGNARHKAMLTSKLEARYRLPREPIARFADEVMQLARRAHAGLDAQAQEAIALNQLYKSISPELKYQCITNGCTTVAEAVDIVDTYEGIVLEAKEGRKFKVCAVAQEEESNMVKLEKQIKTLTETVMQLKNGSSASQRTSGPQRCFLCNSTEHFMRDCPRSRYNQHSRRERMNASAMPLRNHRNSEN